MKILVTGATGFIGSAFVRAAVAGGHHVAGLVRPDRSKARDLQPDPNVIRMQGTLAHPPWEQIEAFRADVCVHGAWIVTPGVCFESPENQVLLQQSLEFLRRLAELGVRHVVGLGTCIEYQITRQPLSEDRTPIGPTTAYARCKNELRITLESSARIDGQHLCWARVFYPYGPGEHPARLCSYILDKLRRGDPVFLRTPDSVKDYIYISDLAAALLTVVEQRVHGSINLGSGEGVTIRQMASGLAALLNRCHLIREASPPEHDPFPFVVSDAGKLRALGWKPRVSLADGLRLLIEAPVSSL